MGTEELRSWPKIEEKSSHARHGGGAHAVTIGDIPSLEGVQVHPNAKCRSYDPSDLSGYGVVENLMHVNRLFTTIVHMMRIDRSY